MINPLKITQGQFDRRWDEMPESLRELLYSPEHAEIIRLICENHHLSEEKIETVLGVVGSIIAGFIHIQDLDHQIVVVLDLNPELAKTLALEINERVLVRFEKEIEDVFQPVLTTGGAKKKEKENNNLTNVKIVDEDVPGPVSLSEKPFILHQEKSEAPEEKKSSFKGFSMPFGFFKSKNQPTPAGKSTKVEIETSGDSPKNEKRTVNYNELRTSLSPFEVEQNFINPVKNEPVSALIVPIPEIKPVPAAPEISPLSEEKKSEIFGTIKKPQPKTEGNTIDLR
ncbi:MAG: hypothetical protein AAB377_01475 [Patescibacteria group bacterium]